MTGPDLLGALASSGSAAGPDRALCSRRGCGDPAVWALLWNNPKIHDPERRKTWTACPAHRAYLEEFLTVRGFLREVRPLEELSTP